MRLLKKSFISFLYLILLKRKQGVIQQSFFLGVSNLLGLYGTFQESPLKKGACNLGCEFISFTEFSPEDSTYQMEFITNLGRGGDPFWIPVSRETPLILGHVFFSTKIVLFWGNYFPLIWRNPLFGILWPVFGSTFFLPGFWIPLVFSKNVGIVSNQKRSHPPLKNPLLLRGMCLGESGGISTCGNDQSQKHLLDHFPVLVPLGKKPGPG